MIRAVIRVLTERIRRAIWGVRLHEPGHGQCHNCMVFSPDNGGLCTVVLIGAPAGVELTSRQATRMPNAINDTANDSMDLAITAEDMPGPAMASNLRNGNYMLRVDAEDECHYAAHGLVIENIDMGHAAQRARQRHNTAVDNAQTPMRPLTVKSEKQQETDNEEDAAGGSLRHSTDDSKRVRTSQGV